VGLNIKVESANKDRSWIPSATTNPLHRFNQCDSYIHIMQNKWRAFLVPLCQKRFEWAPS